MDKITLLDLAPAIVFLLMLSLCLVTRANYKKQIKQLKEDIPKNADMLREHGRLLEEQRWLAWLSDRYIEMSVILTECNTKLKANIVNVKTGTSEDQSSTINAECNRELVKVMRITFNQPFKPNSNAKVMPQEEEVKD